MVGQSRAPVGAPQDSVPAPVMRDAAFIDVRVLTMKPGELLEHQTVLVRDGVVMAIGPSDRILVPPHALRISGGGRAVLMPGLVDTHVHLEAEERTWIGRFLAAGVTTVFNLRGEARHLALRTAIRNGQVAGPRIYTSGSYVNLPMVQSAEDAVRAVQEQKSAGYDMLKIHGNVAPLAYDALGTESARLRIPLIGHAPRNLPFDSVLTHPQVMVAHAEELIYTHFRENRDTTGIAPLARRMVASGTWLTATLTCYHAIARQIGHPSVVDSALADGASRWMPAGLRTIWGSGVYTRRDPATAPSYESAFTFQQQLVRGLARGGVPLLAGTDTPLPLIVPGASLLDELQEFVDAGLTPEQALATATVNPGRFIRQHVDSTDRSGVVEIGARADFVLVSQDPRATLSTLRQPLGVMTGGRWYDRRLLRRLSP